MSNATQELSVGEVDFLAECYAPGLTRTQVEQAIADLHRSAGSTDSCADVRCVGSIFVPADEVVFYLFAAPSADAVREVCHRAGLACERVANSIGLSTSVTRDSAVALPRGI